MFSCQHFVLCTVSSCRLLLAAIINSRPPSVPNRATCGSKTELARCTETKIRPELGHPLSKRSQGTPPFSERCSSLLKMVRFGYGSLINLFSTALSIQANSRVQSLSVSAKRTPGSRTFARKPRGKIWEPCGTAYGNGFRVLTLYSLRTGMGFVY